MYVFFLTTKSMNKNIFEIEYWPVPSNRGEGHQYSVSLYLIYKRCYSVNYCQDLYTKLGE